VTAPFTKSRPGAPAGFFAVEAAGLAWLRGAGGPAVPDVVEVGREHIVLARVTEVAPTARAAEQLGRGLARMHRAGAPHHGAPPAGWSAGAGACGCASPPPGPGLISSPPQSPGCRPSPPADQPEPPLRQKGTNPGPVEPRPPGATAGPPGTPAR